MGSMTASVQDELQSLYIEVTGEVQLVLRGQMSSRNKSSFLTAFEYVWSAKKIVMVIVLSVFVSGGC